MISVNKMHIIIFLSCFTILYACKSNRPQKAATEYCNCYEQKLKQGIDEMITQVYCDSLLIGRYPELYRYYVKRKDTSGWNEATKFHSVYVEYKAQYCHWQINEYSDSEKYNKGIINDSVVAPFGASLFDLWQ